MTTNRFELDRRSFLKLTLGVGAAVGSGLSIPQFARAEGLLESVDDKVPTFCGVCSGGCAMTGYVKDGRLLHLEGNSYDQAAGDPWMPEGSGRLCVKAHASIRTLYDPDRLKTPLKRTNPNKGIGVDPGFVAISWDEAIDTVATEFNEIIDNYGPESLAFFLRSNDFTNRLGKAIGTPNYIAHQSTCFTTQQAAWMGMVTGSGRPWTYDIQNCKYILSFGWDGLGKSKNPHVRNAARALSRGAKLVVFDPFRSTTASKSHEWWPVKPGTDLALCLAMIHVIVTEELYNREFVANYTSGFDKLREFATVPSSLNDHTVYTPEWAEQITEISADVIRRIAREFAAPENQPAHIPSHKRDAAGPNYANSTRLAQTQITLNALVGTIDREGGTILPRNPRMPSFDAVFPLKEGLEYPSTTSERIDAWDKNNPLLSRATSGNFATVADGILSEKPYPVKGALVRSYNVLSFPNARRMAEAFSKLAFMVCFEIYPSEMAQLADIVLPEPHWLEISGMGPRSYHSTYPQIAVRLPIVKPVHEGTKGFGGVIVNIAKAMGLGDFFLDTSEGGDDYITGGKFNNKRLQALGTSWDELASSPHGLWDDKQPLTPREQFNTPSGKVEFYATLFEQNGFDPLPKWQPRREAPCADYPYNYLIGRPAIHKMTQTQNNDLTMEICPENHATMHVSQGEKLGIRDGDEVYVESRVGRIKLKAKLIEGIRSDCVKVMHGFGHWSKDLTIAHGKGANDGDLIPDMTAAEMAALNDPGMGACMTDFGVKVYKA